MGVNFSKGAKVFVYQKPIDMRCGFERLSYFIKEEMKQDLNFGDVFIFLGNNRKRLKALYFDGSGLVQLVKRMEKRKGFMSVFDLDGRSEISRSELELLLHGSVLRRYSPEVKTKEEKSLPVGANC